MPGYWWGGEREEDQFWMIFWWLKKHQTQTFKWPLLVLTPVHTVTTKVCSQKNLQNLSQKVATRSWTGCTTHSNGTKTFVGIEEFFHCLNLTIGEWLVRRSNRSDFLILGAFAKVLFLKLIYAVMRIIILYFYGRRSQYVKVLYT